MKWHPSCAWSAGWRNWTRLPGGRGLRGRWSLSSGQTSSVSRKFSSGTQIMRRSTSSPSCPVTAISMSWRPRLCQSALLLAEIDRLQTLSWTPVIVTGDLNSDPWSPVVKLLTSGRFAYSGSILGRKAKRPAPHKMLPDSLGLSDSCQWLVSLQHYNSKVMTYCMSVEIIFWF